MPNLTSVWPSAEVSRASQSARRGSGYIRRKARARLTESARADLRDLLGELALALLPRGITPNSFSKLAREAFIRAAAGHARLRNGKVNHSKIAALTGLPRKEIKRVLSRASTGLEADSMTHLPSERVLRGWLTDRRSLTRHGHPKLLALGGKTFSFERLVKEYGGDVSPRAVLEELMRAKTVLRTGQRLELQAFKLPNRRNRLGPLARIIPILVDGLRIASRQPVSAIDSMLYRLRLHAATEAEFALIRQRCSSAIQSLLHGLKESLAHELTIPTRKRSAARTLTVTVLLVDADTSDS